MNQPSEAPATRSVLVIDDEDQVRSLLQMAVQALGHEADVAADGQEALDCLARRSYDVVICDLLMPKITGDEVFRICREEDPGVSRRFVFVTGCPTGYPPTDFAAASGQPFLAKPCRLGDIRVAIDQVVRPVAAA
jgi:two-component system, cell cycle sensor histidine kinase and response regulator CckA